MPVKPLGLSTSAKCATLQGWLFLDTPGISKIRSDQNNHFLVLVGY